ncbi:hypothetical protein [Curtobacterium sp. MCBD17_040]|uniref:hypothetical protein n=1 Tax=Curtobacterium sp. MCBD17_040 TaxID=2175674 RepID=UPI000DA75350|nr:hypothetical protein [Curtobacterium sp. MCBD17_040]WIB65937.1 hypothetical protein DEI94_17640 [Curtobacterium sp. MCBD17_040]
MLALALAGACVVACVLAHAHTAPIDASYRASGPGVFQTPPPAVAAADSILGFTWIAALPVAIVVTLLGAWTVDLLRAEGIAHLLAQGVTVIGVAGSVVGVGLAALGVIELLT